MLPSDATLRTFFVRFYEPLFLNDARPRTIVEYRSTLKIWERVTGLQLLVLIDQLILATFKARLLELGYAPATINKHLRHVHAMLGKAGPAGPGNRDALGLISVSPWTRPFRLDRKLPKIVDLELISRLYDASPSASYPRALCGLSSGLWWQTFIVLAYNLGFRLRALLSLRWCDVDLFKRRVSLCSTLDKCHTQRIKPISSVVLSHLMRVRGDRDLILSWPHGRTTFYVHWYFLLDVAGITGGDRFTPHDLKRTLGSQLARVGSPWAVRYMLDHSQVDVTGLHYVQPLDELADCLERLAQPVSFVFVGKESADVS